MFSQSWLDAGNPLMPVSRRFKKLWQTCILTRRWKYTVIKWITLSIATIINCTASRTIEFERAVGSNGTVATRVVMVARGTENVFSTTNDASFSRRQKWMVEIPAEPSSVVFCDLTADATLGSKAVFAFRHCCCSRILDGTVATAIWRESHDVRLKLKDCWAVVNEAAIYKRNSKIMENF